MRIGASLLLIAVGAILKWGITHSVNGVDLGMIGIILMVIGVVGLLITLVLLSTRRRTDVIHQPGAGYPVAGQPVVGRPVAPSRTTYVEPNDPLV